MVYDIFISYRRKGGFETAKHLYDLLDKDGYSVSFDIDTLREGDFDKALLERIEQCRDFLVVVDQHAFDRMINPTPDYDPEKDWMRKEIAYALKLKKNIVSVLLAGASYPAKLPDDLDKLDRKNGPKYSIEYFDSFYEKLKEKFLHSIPRMMQSSVQNPGWSITNLKIKADIDCTFYLDTRKTAELKAGELSLIPLREGEYELKFVSTENAEDKIVENFRMPAYDKLYSVELLPIKEKRLEQERIEEEVRQKAEQERLEQERIAAEQQAKKEAEKKAKEEARRKAKMEAEKKAKEEAERQVRLEEEKRAKEEAEKERIERERKDREQVFNVKGVEFKMLKVEGGSFWMGADNGKRTRTVTVKTGLFGLREEQKQEEYVDGTVKNYDRDAYDEEKPVHKVTLSSFYMGEVVVTQALWKAVMGSEPTGNGGWESRYGKGDNYPAYRVSYNDIVNDFLPELNRLTGKNFRLPTEAEWEYAARGGKKSHGYKYSGSNTIGDVAWYWENSGDKKLSGSWDWDTSEKNNCKIHPVNCKKPNEPGLYDMSGNVWEWCQDRYGNYNDDPQTNPKGPSSGSYRVLRGGSWSNSAWYCRVSYRYFDGPGFRFDYIGFRLVLPQ